MMLLNVLILEYMRLENICIKLSIYSVKIYIGTYKTNRDICVDIIFYLEYIVKMYVEICWFLRAYYFFAHLTVPICLDSI